MSKAVTHFAKITRRQDRTITGTMCNRESLQDDGINSADDWSQVTCKLCLKHKPKEPS